jgi:hypothetical protein
MLAFNTGPVTQQSGAVNQESRNKSSPLRDNAGPAFNGKAGARADFQSPGSLRIAAANHRAQTISMAPAAGKTRRRSSSIGILHRPQARRRRLIAMQTIRVLLRIPPVRGVAHLF